MSLKSYPPTTREQLQTIRDLCRRAMRGESISADFTGLLPLGSIEAITPHGEGAVAVKIKGHTPRIMPDIAALLLCAYALYMTAPLFNPDKKVNKPNLNIYLYCPNGVSFLRALVGARAGETVRLGRNHYDLRPEAGLRITGTPKYGMGETTDARSKALRIALANHEMHAEKLGLADLLSSEGYRELIESLQRAFDGRYEPILRPPLAVAAE